MNASYLPPYLSTLVDKCRVSPLTGWLTCTSALCRSPPWLVLWCEEVGLAHIALRRATHGGKHYLWKNVPTWSPLYRKLQQHPTTPPSHPTAISFTPA